MKPLTPWLALAPARDGAILPCNRKKPRPIPDALVLLDHAAATKSTDGSIGRHELRLAHWQACPCSSRKRSRAAAAAAADLQVHSAVSSLSAGDNHEHQLDSQPSASCSSTRFCSRCEHPWTKHMGKKFITFESSKDSPKRLGMWIQLRNGTYPVLDKMSLNGKLLRDYGLEARIHDNQQHHQHDRTIYWLGPLWIQLGDSISFAPLSDDDSFNMEFQVVLQQGGRLIPANHQNATARDSMLTHERNSNCCSNSQRSSSEIESPLKTQPYGETQIPAESGSRFPHFFEPSESQEESQQLSPARGKSPVLLTPPIFKAAPRANNALQQPNSQTPPQTANVAFFAQRSEPRERTEDSDKPGSDQMSGGGAEIVAKSSSKHSAHGSPTPRLYFVKCNRHSDMFNKQIRERAERKAIARGAQVFDTFNRDVPPTHFVVGNALRMDEGDLLNDDLKFHSVPELRRFAEAHQIAFVRLKWVMKGGESVALGPTAVDEVYRLALHDASPGLQQGSPRKRQRDDPFDSQIIEYKNKELGELFAQLSTLYREAPTKDQDLWRAYTFSRAASVMRHLPYGVSIETVNELKKQKGLSTKCVDIASEYLTTGTCLRLQRLLSDEERTSIRHFTGIWSVGPKRAAGLYRLGYRTLSDLRTATQHGHLRWYRNEYLGLKYYEDINDEMSREEAQQIVDIVTTVATSERIYPSAHVQAMGSYRRGKMTCGDVDFLITDPAWMDEVPPSFLANLVEKLRADGFVLHHLTLVHGMDQDSLETLAESDLSHIKPSDKKATASKGKRSYTWFGIFRSPVHSDRVRRVDIKVYPYCEHVYASLYFTGNGHFNRAMRFWSKKKKTRPHYRLDDHGLWLLNESGGLVRDGMGHPMRATEPDGRVFKPMTEKDVFDKLGIAWREPHERDGFGAMRSKTEEDQADVDVGLDDVLADSRDFAWVN